VLFVDMVEPFGDCRYEGKVPGLGPAGSGLSARRGNTSAQ